MNQKKIIDFICSISKNSYLNIMQQYRPRYKAYESVKINQSLSLEEYKKVLKYAKRLGINTNYS